MPSTGTNLSGNVSGGNGSAIAVSPLPGLEGVPYAGLITQLAIFIGVFLAIYAVGRVALLPFVDRTLKSRDVHRHARKPLERLVRGIVAFAAVSVAFGAAGLGSFLSSLSTVAAAATLALGFAAKDLLANFVAGVFIYIDKPFRIGDWIEWEDFSGEVEDIALRVSRVRTFDNELLTVPNSELANNVIKNPVEGQQLRLKFLFGIGYDDDIERATEILLEEADAHPDTLEDPEPSVRVTELDDSYVGLKSRFWISQPSRTDFVKTKSEYVKSVKQRFDEEEIEIPYPQRTLTGEVRVSDLDDGGDDESTEERGAEDEERGEGGRGESGRGEGEGESVDGDE